MTETELAQTLARYSRGDISAVEARRLLGNVTYGDILIALAQRGLPLPQAPQAGREEEIRRARELLFPKAP